ncbi:MAG: DUF3892 domain-containing protein [Lachnospiraceae bacterium]|nr:DUF3892 domain-containing protein [Lachnospiraceae bacterium]
MRKKNGVNVEELPKAALDEIPSVKENAVSITGLVKKKGRIIGYQLSDQRVVSREEGVSLAKSGDIKGVGIAHRKETEYLKSIPDGSENNNLSALPTVSAEVLK